jgi:hypothetical protein
MIVNPVSTGLFWVWFTFLALIAYLVGRALIRLRLKNWSPKHQWKIFAAFSVVVLLPWTVYLELFEPPIGGIYSNEAAEFWIRRAARESDRGKKEAQVARLVLSSGAGDAIGKNSFVAKGAISRVEDPRERCILRTILAGLPNIPDQSEREHEARAECARAPKP